ncbi:MAG: glucose dehydrogenase, partial [Candidatus Wukongarchaeota archaeon]|nr:glucose dehydrogenase [Candidatus Wukongarchaeota archaeon]
GKVFTELVLKNRLIFGSVNANKKYFEMGISHILEIKKRNMDDVLKKMITRVKIEDFKKAFEKGGIKTVIEFGSV